MVTQGYERRTFRISSSAVRIAEVARGWREASVLLTLPDPYSELAKQWPAVRVRIRNDLGREAGQTLWLPDGSTEIHLAHNLTRVERRCSLAHEISHLRRGKPPRSRDRDDEDAVIRDTARWLIPDLSQFAATLAAEDVSAAAARFDVINAIIYERLDHLTKFEMEHLTAAMSGPARLAG